MRLIAVILALLTFSTSQALAHNWSRVFAEARGSVVMLFHKSGSCSAFSINEQQHYYLTAHHCLPNDPSAAIEASRQEMDRPSPTGMYLFLDAVPGVRTMGTAIVLRVLKADATLDVALLEAEVGLPALPRGSEPRIGEDIAALGYALSEPGAWLIVGNVAYLKDAVGGQRRVVLRSTSEIGGMSGGPVIDTRGRVISIVSQGVVYRGQIVPLNYGTSIRQLEKFTKGFWREN